MKKLQAIFLKVISASPDCAGAITRLFIVWRRGGIAGGDQFFVRFLSTLVPIHPTEFPGFAGIELMGLGPEFVEGFKERACQVSK
jgi:hypothetical protein